MLLSWVGRQSVRQGAVPAASRAEDNNGSRASSGNTGGDHATGALRRSHRRERGSVALWRRSSWLAVPRFLVGSRRKVEGDLQYRTLDLASNASVSEFAAGILASGRSIDVLI